MEIRLLLIALIWSYLAIGQTDTLDIHYFKTGELSTIITLEDSRRGQAVAYKKNGEKIYSKEIRKIAGTASVHFKHYGSGALKKAVYYSAPDGGIQWERVTSYFNVQGKLLREVKEGHDHDMEIFSHHKEQVFCNPVHTNEIVVVNRTKATLNFILDDKKKKDTLIVGKKDSLLAKNYISAETSQHPHHFYNITAKPYKKRILLFFKNKKEVRATIKKENITHRLTRYYYYLDTP